jgi:hypothetical protein
MLGLFDKLNTRKVRGEYLVNKPAHPWLAMAWALPFLPGVILSWWAVGTFTVLALVTWAGSKKGKVRSVDGAADLWITLGPLAAIVPDVAGWGGIGVAVATAPWLAGVVLIRVRRLTDEIRSYGTLDQGAADATRLYLRTVPGRSTIEQLAARMARSILQYNGQEAPGV